MSVFQASHGFDPRLTGSASQLAKKQGVQEKLRNASPRKHEIMEIREARRSQREDVSGLLSENGWQLKYENPQDRTGPPFNDYTLHDVILL